MFYLGLLIVLVGVDQVIKFAAVKYFGAHVLINSAGPFSIKGGSYLFAVLSVAVIIIFLLAMKKYLIKNRNLLIPVTLIISGGLSNVIDRLARRGVVDFIDLKIWPSFNLADVFISLGVILIIFYEIKKSLNSRSSSSRP